MRKEFVPYVESLELKELGFDEPCFCVYSYDKLLKNNMVSSSNGDRIEKDPHDNRLNAPLYQQAFRWFSEKYSIETWVQPFLSPEPRQFNGMYWYGGRTSCDGDSIGLFRTYKEAELTCLRKLIELCKNKMGYS